MIVYIFGNLEAKRDWGYAPEYCEGMWKILQQSVPEDFVFATGKAHSVKEFIELTFQELDIDIEWHGKNEKEIGKDLKTGKIIVKVDPSYYRPTEVDMLVGDPSKANKSLGWKSKTSIEKLIKIMVQSDMQKISNGGSS